MVLGLLLWLGGPVGMDEGRGQSSSVVSERDVGETTRTRDRDQGVGGREREREEEEEEEKQGQA